MSELLLSFYPSVKSLLSLLPAWEISAIPILLLGLAQAEQCDGLAQRLLEVNRKILGILLDYSSDQPRNQGLSRGHDKRFLGTLPLSPSLSLFWGNCKKKTNPKPLCSRMGNLESFQSQAPACWGCQGLPWCRVPPQCQHHHHTGLLNTSWKRRPGCLWACLTLVTGQTNYSSLPLPSLPLNGCCLLFSWRGLSSPWGSVPKLLESSRGNSSLRNRKVRMMRDGTGKEQHEREK